MIAPATETISLPTLDTSEIQIVEGDDAPAGSWRDKV